MTSSTITGALVVCVAAAGIAVGALVLEPGDATPAAPASGAAAPAPGGANQAPAGGGYGSSGNAGNGGDTGNGAGAPAGAALEISGFQFGATTVGAGGQVTVSNRDGAPHTVTADEGAFDSGQVGGGSTGAFVAPSQPGTYGFHCEIHPDMAGTLTVG
jgi:plastocyanin